MIYELLQKELREAKETRYAISQATGINEAVLCKIYNNDQAGIWLKTAETLLDYFGYRLTKDGK
jgi:hypothetical protein